MFQIVEKKTLVPNIVLLRILAPRIARKQKAGQFVIVRVNEQGERIPLTIAEASPEQGTITLVVQAVGKTTKLLCACSEGEFVMDVVGPLGRPSELHRYGTAIVIGGGVGTAIAYPTARALKQAGNHVISIIGGRSKELVILEDEVRSVSDEVHITTDDGTYGEKGLVTDKLRALITSGLQVGYVLAIGPVPMMRAVAETTRPHGIKTVISLNPIMVDGTGMCGGCRVVIDGQSRFACVHGPEFDAHQVDFALLTRRNATYRNEERVSLERYEAAAPRIVDEHRCKLNR